MNNTDIAVYCHTNIDKYRQENWPSLFPCKPVVGEHVRSLSGVELEICQVVYTKEQVVYIELTWATLRR